MKALSFVEGGLLIPSTPKGQVLEKGRGSYLGKLCGGKFFRKQRSPGNGGSEIIMAPTKTKSENVLEGLGGSGGTRNLDRVVRVKIEENDQDRVQTLGQA